MLRIKWNRCRTGPTFFLVLVLVLMEMAESKVNSATTETPAAVVYTETVVGGVADVSCDLRSAVAGDHVLLVLWYRNEETLPFYSVDARGKYLTEAQHWAADSIFAGRAHVRAASDRVRLVINGVQLSDEGVYKCRVDFKKSPTRNSRINLSVIIPPSKPIILDGNGSQMPNRSGLYDEGSSLSLVCLLNQGRPVARVTWYEDGKPKESQVESLSGGQVRSVLKLGQLRRNNHGATYSCAASNSRTLPGLIASTTLHLRLPILEVKIDRDLKAVSAGKPHQISCRVTGSSPAPRISWWKGDIRLQPTRETVSLDGNVTTSTLTFIVSSEDGGRYLTCRAENLELPSSIMEDTWKIDVHYVPVVHLELGSKLKASLIKEGDDVYMECNIRAHPWVSKVAWKHNGKVLHQNSSAGIIMSNQSLVLQRIDRHTAGIYTCLATNSEGQGESNALPLPVRFRPHCQPHQQLVYGASRGESLQISCGVEAHPSDVTFRWMFNSSLESVDVSVSSVENHGLRSIVHHRVVTERDYGSLLCWARNSIGEQKDPCIFSIQPAGEPSSPWNCSVYNMSGNNMVVNCSEGYDGGLAQSFLLQVVAVKSEQLVANVTSVSPHFNLSTLEPGTSYELSIWALNAKGKSSPVVLMAETSAGRAVERRSGFLGPTTQAVVFHMTPVLGALIGIVATLIIVAVVIVVVVRTRGHSDGLTPQNGSKGPSPTGRSFDVPQTQKNDPPTSSPQFGTQLEDDKNPDVVPNKSDSSTRNIGVSTISSHSPQMACYISEGQIIVSDIHSAAYTSAAETEPFLAHLPAPVSYPVETMIPYGARRTPLARTPYDCTYTVDCVAKESIATPRRQQRISLVEEELTSVRSPLIPGSVSVKKNPRESAV